nr:MAG TPA: hypothetical protein [Caudoviricetes sp.]
MGIFYTQKQERTARNGREPVGSNRGAKGENAPDGQPGTRPRRRRGGRP